MLSDPEFRELVTLPLPTSVLREFSRVGYNNVGEVGTLTVEQIASICKLSKFKAASVLSTIQNYTNLRKFGSFSDVNSSSNLFYPHSALQMLYPSHSNLNNVGPPGISNVLTMSKSFDELMDGGFPCGRITELCGQPGVGKTQFCLQTCLTVQIPNWCGGLAGEAVFLDTEGNFMPKRLRQMAKDLVSHFHSVIAPCLQHHITTLSDSVEDSEERAACEEALCALPSEEDLLNKVHYIRCTDYLQLLAAVRRLNEFCKYHPNTRLIIVDSIALPFRYEFEDIPQRNRLLAALSQSLLLTAGNQNAAVIVTNQITTKIVSHGTSTASHGSLVPALGDSWGHICSIRILLSKGEGSNGDLRRIARLLKHPGRPPGTATYQITTGGIRDSP
ncbi:hypothetical protein Aperf_G00000033654 [Anoplocephala perfoliata]